jgi:hypothetical protein
MRPVDYDAECDVRAKHLGGGQPLTVRLDPTQTTTDVEAALTAAVEAAWGADALPEVARAIPSAAQALWRISQESLGPTDVEP